MVGLGLSRPLVAQQFNTFSFAVGIAAVPILANAQKQDLITTFIISNPIAGASVYLGNQGVSTTTGLEILAGTTPVFTVLQEGRQMYELQTQLMDINAGLQCRSMEIEKIPFIVWDMSNQFLVAAAPTTVSIALYPAMYL